MGNFDSQGATTKRMIHFEEKSYSCSLLVPMLRQSAPCCSQFPRLLWREVAVCTRAQVGSFSEESTDTWSFWVLFLTAALASCLAAWCLFPGNSDLLFWKHAETCEKQQRTLAAGWGYHLSLWSGHVAEFRSSLWELLHFIHKVCCNSTAV